MTSVVKVCAGEASAAKAQSAMTADLVAYALQAEVAFGEQPGLHVIECAAATPLGYLPRNLLVNRGVIDGSGIVHGGLLNEHSILRRIFGGSVQPISTLCEVSNRVPLRISADS